MLIRTRIARKRPRAQQRTSLRRIRHAAGRFEHRLRNQRTLIRLCRQHQRDFPTLISRDVRWTGRAIAIEHTHAGAAFRLEHLNTAIRIVVTATIIMVTVQRDQEIECILADFEFLPKKVRGGWIDALNLPWCRTVHPTVAALWQHEVQQPFRQWLRERLRSAECVILSGTDTAVIWGVPGKFTDLEGEFAIARLPAAWRNTITHPPLS